MANNKTHSLKPHSQETLKKELNHIVRNEQLSDYRKWVEKIAAELNIDYLDCAAALIFYNQPEWQKSNKLAAEKARARSLLSMKMVRYRLEVGRKHRVSMDEIKKLMVDEAGVESTKIGSIDIRYVYTLISLPEGMPTEIYLHLKEVQINQQELNIKRLGRKNRQSKTGNTRHRGKPRNFQAKDKNQQTRQQGDTVSQAE